MTRIRLSESLQAVISQRLVPTADAKGRVAACEIMRVTGTIRDCIRDQSRLDEIFDLVEEGREQYGTQSFDQHLMDLVRAGTVSFEIAKAAANNPTDFDLKMNTFGAPSTGSGMMPAQDMLGDMNRLFGN